MKLIMASFLILSVFAEVFAVENHGVDRKIAKIVIQEKTKIIINKYKKAYDHFNKNRRNPKKLVEIFQNKEDQLFMFTMMKKLEINEFKPLKWVNGKVIVRYGDYLVEMDPVSTLKKEITINHKTFAFKEGVSLKNNMRRLKNFLSKDQKRKFSILELLILPANAYVSEKEFEKYAESFQDDDMTQFFLELNPAITLAIVAMHTDFDWHAFRSNKNTMDDAKLMMKRISNLANKCEKDLDNYKNITFSRTKQFNDFVVDIDKIIKNGTDKYEKKVNKHLGLSINSEKKPLECETLGIVALEEKGPWKAYRRYAQGDTSVDLNNFKSDVQKKVTEFCKPGGPFDKLNICLSAFYTSDVSNKDWGKRGTAKPIIDDATKKGVIDKFWDRDNILER